MEAAYLHLREQRRPLWSSAPPPPPVPGVREEERDEDEKHAGRGRAANDDSLPLPSTSLVPILGNGHQLILERLDALQTAFHSLQAAFDRHCSDRHGRVVDHPSKRQRPADSTSSQEGYATDRCPSLASAQGSTGDTSPLLVSQPAGAASQQPSVDGVRLRQSPNALREDRTELVLNIEEQAEDVQRQALPSLSQSSASVPAHPHARPPPRHSSFAPSPRDHRRYEGWTFASQQRGGMEWRLSYRAKGASAAIYMGTPLRPSHTVAVKVALDGDIGPSMELVREAEMMQQVASSHPEAVCQLYHQPALSTGAEYDSRQLLHLLEGGLQMGCSA
jgi:hypothetical protein